MNLEKLRSAIQTADRLGAVVQTGGAQPYTDLTAVDEPMILMTAEQAEELLDLATAAVALAQQQAGALTRLRAIVARLEGRRA